MFYGFYTKDKTTKYRIAIEKNYHKVLPNFSFFEDIPLPYCLILISVLLWYTPNHGDKLDP